MKDLQFSDSDWLHRSSDARCVADRNASQSAVEKAITWGCGKLAQAGHSCDETWRLTLRQAIVYRQAEYIYIINIIFKYFEYSPGKETASRLVISGSESSLVRMCEHMLV